MAVAANLQSDPQLRREQQQTLLDQLNQWDDPALLAKELLPPALPESQEEYAQRIISTVGAIQSSQASIKRILSRTSSE